MTEIITAAGGLVFSTIAGKTRVLIIHRPRYDDWSFPKGKHDDGESDEKAALREIREETEVSGRIVSRLADVIYMTPKNNLKRVTYFGVRAIERPEFQPNAEVDRIEWMSNYEAKKRLTYEHDRELLKTASLRRLDATGHVHLIRHAAAGDRSRWSGDDHDRPLTKKGLLQASAIAGALEPRLASSVLSSPSVRCMETARPLAERLGLAVNTAAFLQEGSEGQEFFDFVKSKPREEIVMVSHGDVIPAIIDRLRRRGVPLASRSTEGPLDRKKGSNWMLTTRNGNVVSGEYIPPPEV